MDFNSIINTITGSDSISQLSSLTGTSQKDVSGILSAALPQLLSGAQGQATNKETAASFANALTAHGREDAADLSSFLGKVDMQDGQKIVDHLLGKNEAAATAEDLAKKSGVSASSITGILAAAAPLLMTLLGKQAAASAQASAQKDSGPDLSGIVGSLFGGGAGADSGGGLGNILSGLFK